MKYLLDTNALIGLLFSPAFLSDDAREIVEQSSELYVSIISLWELGIKQSIGKIDIDASAEELESFCNELGISVVTILASEIDVMKTLPLIHRDPFDRLLIAQAIFRDMTLITKDERIPQYPNVRVLW
ncbi:MAG: type II toxin-antitoxin system VapC family toxin [Oscillospiraceae bacterium]|nr:type II toxin-antitoxin system VapC family toxin [Oscillospiraceae bacterium]